MAYPNLKAEMARYGVTNHEIVELLDSNDSSVSLKVNGKIKFSLDDANLIQSHFFPSMSVGYLFSKEPIAPEAAV